MPQGRVGEKGQKGEPGENSAKVHCTRHWISLTNEIGACPLLHTQEYLHGFICIPHGYPCILHGYFMNIVVYYMDSLGYFMDVLALQGAAGAKGARGEVGDPGKPVSGEGICLPRVLPL